MSVVQERLGEVLGVVREAELAIMSYYEDGKPIQFTQKADGTPVTKADMAAHHILKNGLEELCGVPVLSEEGDAEENAEIARGDRFIALDPIDNTRGFMTHRGEFMIGIADVDHGVPVYGVAHGPVESDTYFGGPDYGSFKLHRGEAAEPIQVKADEPTGVVMVSHRQGLSGLTAMYIRENFPDHLLGRNGSYLKFTQVAEGKADAYPRADSGMLVWDVAPGHAIVTGAGGNVTCVAGTEIDYRAWSPYWSNFVAWSGAVPLGAAA